MRESAVLLALVLLVTVVGGVIGYCAGPAHAGRFKQQTVRLPVTCHPYEVDDDPEGEPIRVYSQPGAEYWLVAQLAGVTTVLAKIPCSTLPRVVQIGGAWPDGAVMGCIWDNCVPAVR